MKTEKTKEEKEEERKAIQAIKQLVRRAIAKGALVWTNVKL